jgi:MEDS: MEthanogen/methylotroph, DcmR Sensory domain
LSDSLRQTGIIVQGSIPWGTHLCLFYETKQDLLDTVVPYFRAGLENKEFCLWILQPSISRQDALEALRRGIPDFDRYLSKGAIKLIPQGEWYTEHGKFELATVVQQFHAQLEQATANGFVGLRANGSSAWLQRTDSTTFGEYEKRLDDAIAETKMIVVCSFSLQDSNSALVFDAARAHQLTAVLRHGSWDVIETHEAGKPNSSKQDFGVVGAAMHQSASSQR